MQLKSTALESAQIKMADDGYGFEGYASVFGGVDSYGDTIVPGAYSKTLEGRDRPVQLKWNHYGPVIGKWSDMYEDEKGLFVKGELTPRHSQAEDTYALLKHGAVSGLSIGYRIPKGGSEEKDGVRHLKEIDLFEISVVEAPADLAAQIGDVKQAIDAIEDMKEMESFLRDVGGFSRSAAKILLSQFKTLCQREADTKEDSSVTLDAETVKQFFNSLRSAGE